MSMSQKYSGFTKSIFCSLMILCLVFVINSSLAWGQAASTSTGTIVGQVTDPSGAVVPKATVTITNAATSTKRTTQTNDTGAYVFVSVQPGIYDITATKTGFSEARALGQVVEVGRQLTVNIPLAVGTATQEVTVQVTGTELQTLNATIGQTITGTALQNMPTLARDVSTFVSLQPGVSPDGSVAGAVVDQSTFLLDGGNNTSDMDGSMNVYTNSFAGDPTGVISNPNNNFFENGGPTGVVPMPQDSIEEVKVATTGQTSEFSNSSGMQVSVVTRRGTNAWHGSVYENYSDNNFSANTWDNKIAGVPAPDWHQNWFGARIGGPIIPKDILGGKTYMFAMYQGFRWPFSETFERAVPGPHMRNGILIFKGVPYNLNPGGNCDGLANCVSVPDPRGIGINPVVQAMWNKYMPLSLANDPSCGPINGSKCDGVNEIGFRANLALPQTDNFGVIRLDHDFSPNWHFMASFRYYDLDLAHHAQVDIGGFFPGDTVGVPKSLASRPQLPWYWVAGLTTVISPHVTNDFHYSFLRNWWARSSQGDPSQLPVTPGCTDCTLAAIEPFGESRTTALVPYNVDTQNTRTRFWNGKDHFFSDNISMLKGNHLLQIGGEYQHNWNHHQRTDNGGGINYFPVYLLGDSSGSGQVDVSAICNQFNIGCSTKTRRDIAAVLGIVTLSQQAYTRTVPDLALNTPTLPHPLPAFAISTINYYNVYFSDSWKMRPSFTLTYGLGYMLEMPPVEQAGRQVELVDQNGQQIDTLAYLNQRKAAALKGEVFNPPIGFALVGKTGNGLKYPYNPFYGSFSPRIAFAWNPDYGFFGGKNTVVRGGYGRLYGRLNGVDQVLVPLLAPGLIQPVSCINALANGTCNANVRPDATTAFRIGVDGNTAPLPAASAQLPSPYFPGINDVNSAAGEALDPHFRPPVVDNFNFSIQHQFSNRVSVEVGGISRWVNHEYQPININSVPYMMTLDGQQFQQAYANIMKGLGCATSLAACGTGSVAAIASQPFLEAALAGTGYCAPGTCTATLLNDPVASGFLTSYDVYGLWSYLDNGKFNFGRTMMQTPIPGTAVLPPCSGLPCGVAGQLSGGLGVNASIGHGNYNAGFVTLRMNDWRGLTMQHNFTYSKALGTGAFVQATSEYTPVDPFDLDKGYGVQNFYRKFVYTGFLVYKPPIYKGQQGLLGHVLGGWTISPIFAAGSGAPVPCNTLTGDFGNLGLTGAGEFGAASSAFFGTTAQCVFVKSPGTVTAHYGVTGSGGIGTDVAGPGGQAVNLFADPESVYNNGIRMPILGIDNRTGGNGSITGLPYWNLDLSVAKNFRLTERFSADASVVFTNVLNHNVMNDPELDASSASSFGVMTVQGNNPRRMGFSIRVSF